MGGRGGGGQHDDDVGRSRETALGVFERHDGIGGGGDGRSRHDPRSLALAERRLEGAAGGQIGDDAQPDRSVGRRPSDVGRSHGESVHGRVVEHRDVDAGGHGLGERAAERIGQGKAHPVEGADRGEHDLELVLDAAQAR